MFLNKSWHRTTVGFAWALIWMTAAPFAVYGTTFQEAGDDESSLRQLRDELAAAQADQVAKQQAIAEMAANLEAAKQASAIAETRLAKMLHAAQDQVALAEQQALAAQAEQAQQQADATAADANALLLARSRYATLAQTLSQAQEKSNWINHYYNNVVDLRSNTALQNYLIAQAQSQANSGGADDYWIGVQCEPAAEFKMKLLPDSDQVVTVKGGLRILAVTADSPAQDAGLQEQDVILYLNDQPINQIEELVALVDAHGEQAASLRIVRSHEPMTISVTPRRRPDVQDVTANVEWQVDPVWRGVHLLSDGLAQGLPELPEGFEAEMHFAHGASPTLRIKSHSESWDVNDENRESLPDEVKPFVEAVWKITRPAIRFHLDVAPNGQQLWLGQLQVDPQLTLRHVIAEGQSGSENATESADVGVQIEQLTEQINELRALIEKMEK